MPPPPPPRRPPPPPPPGPRRAALDDRRKRARNRARLLGGLAAIALIAGVALAVGLNDPPEEDAGPRGDAAEVVPPEEPTTTLLAGTRSTAAGRSRLAWVSLLVLDPNAPNAAVAYIPSLTGTEVPGRGPHSLAEAYGSGGMSLLALTIENMLGVRLDRYAELNERDAPVFFDAFAPLEVDVPAEARVPLGDGTQLLFEPGEQTLDAASLVAYTYRTAEEGDADEMGPRHLAVWSALFARAREDGDGVARAANEAAAAFDRSNEEPEQVASFLAAFLVEGASSSKVRSLPVSPLEVPGDRVYLVDEEEMRKFVSDLVAAELFTGDDVRVQILNGNGSPGSGERVARRLVGNGFRVALTGNARSLSHDETLIITYDPTQEGRAEAARARELLGVGEVQVSLQEQGIVDLTIVVGRDFLRAQ